MRRHRWIRALPPIAVIGAIGVLAWAAAPSKPGDPAGWLTVEYGSLVEPRQLTHSGESVGELLRGLAGRRRPPAGERPQDDLAYRLLDPWLEPYAFVLPDALDSLAPAPDPPMVEVGSLFPPGGAEPAWAAILRSRRMLVESDGSGHLRAFVPWPGGDAALPADAAGASRAAWDAAWPVLRHPLAAERARLAAKSGGTPPALAVESYAYRHRLAECAFDLSQAPYRARVEDTGPAGPAPPFDLAALGRLMAKGARIEGARLEADGRLTLFSSEPARAPSLLGRPLELADAAVAYRAVFHGGLAEPYMSLDKGPAPHVAAVNYGGRLRDTALGFVSLLCDVRFKTFSLGIGVLDGGDLRERLRREVPGFRTHLERFAADPASGPVLAQQTRFWFYPDDVDLTVSETGDVLAVRRVRMSAASERVETPGAAPERADAAWTKDTVAAIHASADRLGVVFPEIAELDDGARLLAFFAWLKAARDSGLATPDLDALLAVPLPAVPTPRAFPELLTWNALPPAGGAGAIDVLDRSAVGDALERLRPRAGALDALRRLRRAAAALDPRVPDQAAAKAAASKVGDDARPEDLDAAAFAAERLLMHAWVLAGAPDSKRKAVADRRAAGEATRVFSVGMGGIDLGMSRAVARAHRGSASARAPGGFATLPATLGASGRGRSGDSPSPRPAASPLPRPSEPAAPPVPDHGLGGIADGAFESSFGESATARTRVAGENWFQSGSVRWAPGRTSSWSLVVLGAEGPDVRARRRDQDPDGKAPWFVRTEGERRIAYRLDGVAPRLQARPGEIELPPAATAAAWAAIPSQGRPASPAAAAEIPGGLVMMDVVAAATHGAEPATVRLRLRAAGGRSSEADLPRGVLDRLVAGRDVDLAPGRPLPGLAPASRVAGGAKAVMILDAPSRMRRPWIAAPEALPGEEDPVRLAAALTAWWRGDEAASPAAVVGTDPARSGARWAAAPLAGAGVLVLAPTDAFPGPLSAVREQLAARLAGAPPVDALPSGSLPGTIVLVSGEAPGVLASRVRALAASPALAGRVLAVVSLSGPVRADVPSGLLAETGISGLGVAEAGPVAWRAVPDAVTRFVLDLGRAERREGRVESPGPFVWFY